MKKIIALISAFLFFSSLVAPSSLFALARKPSKEKESEPVIIRPMPSQPPRARDMQVSTGQIKPVNEGSKE